MNRATFGTDLAPGVLVRDIGGDDGPFCECGCGRPAGLCYFDEGDRDEVE